MIGYTTNITMPKVFHIAQGPFTLGVNPAPKLAFRRGPLTIRQIQDVVADYYGLEYLDMISARRARDVVRPRQIAMYLSKNLTPKSLPDIGRRFGGRDHTTVIHAIKQVKRLCGVDGEIYDAVERLREKLTA